MQHVFVVDVPVVQVHLGVQSWDKVVDMPVIVNDRVLHSGVASDTVHRLFMWTFQLCNTDGYDASSIFGYGGDEWDFDAHNLQHRLYTCKGPHTSATVGATMGTSTRTIIGACLGTSIGTTIVTTASWMLRQRGPTSESLQRNDLVRKKSQIACFVSCAPHTCFTNLRHQN